MALMCIIMFLSGQPFLEICYCSGAVDHHPEHGHDLPIGAAKEIPKLSVVVNPTGATGYQLP
jgi:hypothetical protein